MTDRERLARIFGFEPMRASGALVAAGVSITIPVIPAMWVPTVIVIAALTAILADEARRLREGLAELAGGGFPVMGYRDWLLARVPAFDLELARDMGVDLIEASCAAVDPAIVVEPRGERVVRVIMRRVEVRCGESSPVFLAGDRRRLAEIRDRVLAPLHSDVGIVAMRMGEREALGALAARPVREGTGGDAFRDQAKAAPPDLQSLAHAGTSNRVPPREARSLELRLDRLLFATGQRPTSAGTMSVTAGGFTVSGLYFGPLGVAVGAALGGAIAYAMRRADRRKIDRVVAHATTWPFPVEGYEDWLLSGRPICDIEFGSPPRRGELEHRLRLVARIAELTWLSDTLVRIESEPTMHMASEGILPFWGGDPRELQQLARVVLAPLHDAHRVVAVRMGGYLDRRV